MFVSRRCDVLELLHLRVACRTIRDGVMAQRALYETAIVEMSQMFLPCATDAQGQTLDEKMLNGKVLLGPGSED